MDSGFSGIFPERAAGKSGMQHKCCAGGRAPNDNLKVLCRRSRLRDTSPNIGIYSKPTRVELWAKVKAAMRLSNYGGEDMTVDACIKYIQCYKFFI
ncbi:hypothetical protein EVAR_103401_1 [Eumeta japonica]|uniref:Uncharacterized protein n=1 Tax=Eumeta variegata TaxID=151549 RepID=A0A4C1YUI3_EUMVA|nr:hypothetical protein EVAR_103401_1 [Eumeta japonica]